MDDRPRAITRRTMGRMLLAAPAAAALPPPAPSALAEFIASDEAGLTPAERERLKKSVAETEQALAVVRNFKVPADVAPAVRFRALKSTRR